MLRDLMIFYELRGISDGIKALDNGYLDIVINIGIFVAGFVVNMGVNSWKNRVDKKRLFAKQFWNIFNVAQNLKLRNSYFRFQLAEKIQDNKKDEIEIENPYSLSASELWDNFVRFDTNITKRQRKSEEFAEFNSYVASVYDDLLSISTYLATGRHKDALDDIVKVEKKLTYVIDNYHKKATDMNLKANK